MKQQTAVEWMAIRYHHREGHLTLEDIEKAKQMMKDQIIDAFDMGTSDKDRIGKEYFNQQYENNKQNK